MDLLGVDGWDVMFGDEFHISLDALPLRDVIAKIEYEGPMSIEQLRPSLLLMPARSFNQDHEVLFRACLAATRPSMPGRRHVVPNVLLYDNGTAHWAEAADRFHPNFYVDISDFIDVRRKALGTYASQLPVDQLTEESGSDSTTRTYGTHVCVRFAEAFQSLRLAV
jgi:LmbE family N-acetylglucosaminyl deacetylase